nr:hypothetical protein Iba_chr01aCG3300 [Ipomoea batatas]
MRSHGIGDHSDKSYQSKPPARGRSNLTSCIQTLTVLSISNNQDQDHRDKISVVTMSSSPSPPRVSTVSTVRNGATDNSTFQSLFISSTDHSPPTSVRVRSSDTIFSSSAHFLGDSGDRNPSPSSLR